MSEREKSREGVERLAAAYKEHYARLGKHVTSTEAKEVVATQARTRDNERAAGATKNKAKGVESGKRREREQREQGEANAERLRTIEKIRNGRVFVDRGSKKG